MTGPIIDMTPSGEFPRRTGTPISVHILRAAVMVAVLGAALALAAFALWVALLLIPIVFAAAVIGWLAFRWRMWKLRGRYSAASASPPTRRAPSATRV